MTEIPPSLIAFRSVVDPSWKGLAAVDVLMAAATGARLAQGRVRAKPDPRLGPDRALEHRENVATAIKSLRATPR